MSYFVKEFLNKETGVQPDIADGVTIEGVVDCIGKVKIEKDVFTGHEVAIYTGGHDPYKFGEERKASNGGGAVIIREGVWIGSRAVIIGPTEIGKHSVIGAGSVVKGNVPEYVMVAGNPAVIKKIIPH